MIDKAIIIKRALKRSSASTAAFLKQIDNFLYEHFGPIRILFIVPNGFSFTCQYPLALILESKPNVKIGMVAASPQKKICFANNAQRLMFEKYSLSLNRAKYQKWHYVIHCANRNVHLCRDAIHIMIFHGTVFGSNAGDLRNATLPQIDVIFGGSEYCRAYLSKYAPENVNKRLRVFISVGHPKTDALIKSQYNKEYTLRQLGLPLGRKTILIASHWTPYSILRNFGASLLRELAPLSLKFNILQTGHNHLWDGPETFSLGMKYDAQKLWNDLKTVEGDYKHVKIVKAVDISPLLNVADLLIVDQSSVIGEYSLCDRPILFFDNPDFRFHDNEIYQLFLEASTPFSNLLNLRNKCEQALLHPERGSVGRRRMREYFFINQGRAAEVAAETIMEMGRIGSTKSSKWYQVVRFSQSHKNSDRVN